MLSQILFSPSLTHIASISSVCPLCIGSSNQALKHLQGHENLVRLHLTAVPRETQSIRHPRSLVKVTWRAPKPHSR